MNAITLSLRAAHTANADPTPAIYIQYSDDGRHIRKWSFEPFDAGTRYIPAFVPHWDNPDGPGAA